jgi:hypothetical protein
LSGFDDLFVHSRVRKFDFRQIVTCVRVLNKLIVHFGNVMVVLEMAVPNRCPVLVPEDVAVTFDREVDVVSVVPHTGTS